MGLLIAIAFAALAVACYFIANLRIRVYWLEEAERARIEERKRERAKIEARRREHFKGTNLRSVA